MKKLFASLILFVTVFNVIPSFCFADTELTILYDKKQDIFWYNTTVSKAKTNTRYRVIGYIVRYGDMQTSVKLDSFDDIDNDNDTVTVPIRIPAHNGTNSVMNRFFATNPGHDTQLIKMWSTDCFVYFDAIMTIVEGPDQTPLAIMSSNGTFTKPGGGMAQLGKDYFTSASSIIAARAWREPVPTDIGNFFKRKCEMKGMPVPPDKRDKPVARIYKGGTIVTGTLLYMDNEEINLTGSGDKDFPPYANHKFYRWEYKPSSSSAWTTIVDGEGKVSPAFPKLSIGNYKVRLTVWYGIGDIVYTDMNDSTQVTLNISQAPQGAYVIAEPSTDGDKMVTQAQIDSNETINISVSVTGTLKNYTDTSKITQWRNHLRKDPSGSDDQYKAFTYTSGLGLSQMSQKTFTVKAGVLKSADSYTQKFAVASYVTVNGQVLQSSTEYCSVTLYKGIPPPPPVTNIPPVADISAPVTVKAGDKITIFGTGSYDPDGSIVRYIWNVQGADKNLPEEPYGDVIYSKEGQYTILLVVVDDGGASGYTRVTITVEPPTPDAHFTVAGIRKEMRIISLANSSSSPTRYPLTTSKNKWTITPVDGSGASADGIYKVTNKSSVKEKVTGDPLTSTNLSGLNSAIITFTKAGQYDITLNVTNTAGYTDSETQRISVQQDLPPVAKFKSDQIIYRETIVNDANYAKITVNDESYSPDGDFINYRKIWAIYDANNNGIFGDAADQTIVISETSDRNEIDRVKTYEYLTKEVGKYLVHVTVKESYIP